MSCPCQLVTGVITQEADLTALLGCSAQEWEEVKSEVRMEGRVSVARPGRQVRRYIMHDSTGTSI